MGRFQDLTDDSAEAKLKLFFYYINMVKKKSAVYGHVPNVDQILKVFKDAMHDNNGI